MICGVCLFPIAQSLTLSNSSNHIIRCKSCNTVYQIDVNVIAASKLTGEELRQLSKQQREIHVAEPWGGKK